MFLFIGSEIMLFGAFFTAYFFVRVADRDAVADAAVPAAGLRRVHQHLHPRHLERTMHWSLQAIKKGNVWGLRAGLLLTFLMGLTFLISQVAEYLRIGFNTGDGAFPTIFFCLTGLHGAHVFVGLSILLFMTIRAFRGHFSAEHHHGVEMAGIYWHFVDVMWIVVYLTVYIL